MPNRRAYTDDQLRAAITSSTSWAQVLRTLGKPPNYSTKWPKRHAEAAGISTAHLDGHHMARVNAAQHSFGNPVAPNGGKSGLSVACRWFLDRGYNVSIPLEPAEYDLVAESDRGLVRVQVKTTRHRAKNNRHQVSIRRKLYDTDATANALGKYRRIPYTAEQIDYFFIHTGSDQQYLIPIESTNGQGSLVLDMRYEAFLV